MEWNFFWRIVRKCGCGKVSNTCLPCCALTVKCFFLNYPTATTTVYYTVLCFFKKRTILLPPSPTPSVFWGGYFHISPSTCFYLNFCAEESSQHITSPVGTHEDKQGQQSRSYTINQINNITDTYYFTTLCKKQNLVVDIHIHNILLKMNLPVEVWKFSPFTLHFIFAHNFMFTIMFWNGIDCVWDTVESHGVTFCICLHNEFCAKTDIVLLRSWWQNRNTEK